MNSLGALADLLAVPDDERSHAAEVLAAQPPFGFRLRKAAETRVVRGRRRTRPWCYPPSFPRFPPLARLSAGFACAAASFSSRRARARNRPGTGWPRCRGSWDTGCSVGHRGPWEAPGFPARHASGPGSAGLSCSGTLVSPGRYPGETSCILMNGGGLAAFP